MILSIILASVRQLDLIQSRAVPLPPLSHVLEHVSDERVCEYMLAYIA